MNRLGLVKPADLSPAQQTTYDALKEYTTTNYGNKFGYLDSEDRFIGPFGIHLHHPELAGAFIHFAKALRLVPGLPAEARECAILGVGSRLEAAYEQYAHNKLSGFTEEEQRELHSGKCPEHFTAAQKIAFKVAIDLGKPGPLDSETWNTAVEVLGRDGATALVHYVGFYCYVSTILNGFDAKIPETNSA